MTMVQKLRSRTCPGRVAGTALIVVLAWVSSEAKLAADPPPVHYHHAGAMPPGAIGSGQLLRGGPLPGYFQPVEIKGPPGVLIAPAAGGAFEEPRPGTLTAGMLIGAVYRLRVTNVPLQAGIEVYPTVEVIDRIYPPVGQEFKFPIPIELTQEELELAISGRFVTRVIYLEDPERAVPVAREADEQAYFEVKEGDNPLEVADSLGRPVAILRMGGAGAGPGRTGRHVPVLLSAVCPLESGAAAQSVGRQRRGVAPAGPQSAGGPSSTGERPGAKESILQAAIGHTMMHAMNFQPLVRRSARLCALVACLTLASCATLPENDDPLLGNSARSGSAMAATAASADQAVPRAKAVPASEPADDIQPVVATDGPSFESIPTPEQIDRAAEATPELAVEPQCYRGVPLPMCNNCPWAPPGISGPWPRDEYLEDGGDNFVQVNLGPGGQIRGLELEDTVAIYDTKDGGTCIKPSNQVCLYSPRFAAVRRVDGVIENLQNDQLVGIEQPVLPQQNLEDRLATTAVQPIGPEGGIATRQPSIERTNEVTTPAESLQPILGVEAGLATYENLLLMRKEIFEESEKARVADLVEAAIVWTDDKAVQVVLDGRAAVDVTGDQRAQATFRVDEPNHPCLRIIKIASKKTAKPGEIVDFTIRFDNTGDQEIKRVVIIDNLTTRLEYVPQTAQSSRRAEFTTEVNDGDSLMLRWDFVDPLPVGEGGLVRFHCRVR